MIELFLITGPAGVGKSTISLKIAESMDKSCLIEGDEVYHLVKGGYVSPWKKGNHLDLFWENSLSLISNCLKKGFNVIFNYILNKEDIKKIKKIFPNIQIKFIVLMVDEKMIIERDKLRPQDCQMGERSLKLLRNMQKENFNKNNILDSSNLSIEETFKEIINNNRFII